MSWTRDKTVFGTRIRNDGGKTLGIAGDVPILEQDGFAFKDLARTGELLPYEDWRLDPETRAADLAGRLNREEIAGLMLYSAHQAVPNAVVRHFAPATYGGKPYAESGAKPWELTDQQKAFLKDDNVRHVLATTFESPETAARWNNEMQALVEGEARKEI